MAAEIRQMTLYLSTFLPFLRARGPSPPILLTLWQFRLWSFQGRDAKLERFLAKNNCSQMKSLDFASWCYGEVSKVPKVNFLHQNHPNLSNFVFFPIKLHNRYCHN